MNQEPWEDPDNRDCHPEGGWTRRGACNGCGFCCQFSGRTIAHLEARPLPGKQELDWDYYKVREYKIQKMAQGYDASRLFYLFAPCSQHDTKHMMCRIQETKPETCKRYPEHAAQVVGTPCSYWFERTRPDGRIERWGGEQSPHPGTGIAEPEAITS